MTIRAVNTLLQFYQHTAPFVTTYTCTIFTELEMKPSQINHPQYTQVTLTSVHLTKK